MRDARRMVSYRSAIAKWRITVWFGCSVARRKASHMQTRFVPEDFRVPQRIEQATYVLRPLTTTDVEKDYEAVMSSKDSLRQIFSEHDAWPDEQMTLQE